MVTIIFIIIEVLFATALFIGTHIVEKLSENDSKPAQQHYKCRTSAQKQIE